MKRFILLISLITLINQSTAAQQLSLSPTSIIAWGVTPVTAKAELSWGDVSIIWIGPHRAQRDRHGSIYAGTNTGIFWHPLHKQAGRFWIRGGIGAFKDPFPNESHTRINASIKAGFNLTSRFAISYAHISNAFTGKLNAGVDNLSLTISLNN
jgi:hypothetical protein